MPGRAVHVSAHVEVRRMRLAQRSLEEGRLVVFVGAGCSMMPPTSLPSWWQVNRAVLRTMARRADSLLPDAQAIADAIGTRQDAWKLPPEYFADVMAGTIGDRYFGALRALDSSTPNLTHRAIARLAGQGAIRAIVTTNFDRCIEAAFASEGVPLKVRYTVESLQELAEDVALIGRAGAPCQLLKIHGSAHEPDTLVDTLSQRKRGLPAPTVTVLRHLLDWGHWLFLGYSGADLQADPDYLFVRPSVDHARGFTWLVLEGEKPLDAVASLAEAYGVERAEIAYGRLPAWLFALAGEQSPSPSSNDREVTRRGAADPASTSTRPPPPASHDLDDQLSAWAAELGDFTCGVLLASLAEVAAESDIALHAMRRLLAAHPLGRREARLSEERLEDGAGAIIIDWSDPHDPPRALVTGDRKRVLAVVRGQPAVENELDATIFHLLCLRLASLTRSKGALGEAEQLQQQAIAVAAASGAIDRFAFATGQYANLLKGRGELDRASRLFELAIEAASGEPNVRADLQNDFAAVLTARGNMQQARAAVEDALRLRISVGDELGRAGALVNLAGLSTSEDADRLYGEALAVLDRIGNDKGRASVLINRGKLRRAAGDLVQSEADYDAARVIAERLDDRYTLAMALHGVAVALDEQNDAGALDLYHQALEAAEAIGFSAEAASILNNIARLHRDRGDEAGTRQARTRAMALYDAMNNAKGRAETSYGMGIDAFEFGRPADVIEPARLALELYTNLGDARRRLESGNNLAAAMHDTGDHASSAALYGELLPEAEKHAFHDLCARIASGLGKCALALQQVEDAVQWFGKAVVAQSRAAGPIAAGALAHEIATRAREDHGLTISSLDLAGNTFNAAAQQLADAGHGEIAAQYLRVLIALADAADDVRWRAPARANLGYVLRTLERGDAAVPVLHEALAIYRAANNHHGTIFPIESLIAIAAVAEDHDSLADGYEQLAQARHAIGDELAAAEAAANAAAFRLLPFADSTALSEEDASKRVARADALLAFAIPILAEHGSDRLERAEYDRTFVKSMKGEE
jgi:tetratricopeptide (TPR) repeat protein